MGNKKRRHSDLATKEFHIKAWQESNLAKSKYARLNGIIPSTFYTWTSKAPKALKKEKLELLPVNIFSQRQTQAPKKVGREVPSNNYSGLSLEFRNKFIIRINKGFDGDTFKKTLSLLASL